ncbi:MAG TPA: ATP-binding cassette domain-containing protein [Ignavibacteriaceae bacterium]|nr:ATP-binding cassette domain-containing protein [Ignavibacteriaceae bacterium]
MDILEIKNLSKSFDDLVVLDEVSINVKDGENLVVFGKSGSGKSVLLKCIVGLMQPDSGTILFEGKSVLDMNIDELNESRKHIGFLFQGAALYDSMTVRENLDFPLIRNFNFSEKEREEKIKSVLEKVGLSEAIDKMPAELSGGMKKRIGLARTIITEPDLILYDEPTTGLDPITTKEISQLVVELQKDLKVSSIVVTHDLMCAQIVADHAVVLKDGKIRYQGDLKNLTESDDPFLKNFFGTEVFESG